MMEYLLLKLIHILSSTLLFGTGLGTAFYLWRADKTEDIATISHTAKNVVLADWLFTTPSVIIQPLTGYLMMRYLGYPLEQSWLWWSVVLYVIIGCCWIPVVFIQIHVRNHAKKAVDGVAPFNREKHRKLMRWWYALGWPAFIGVMAIFSLMIFKPI